MPSLNSTRRWGGVSGVTAVTRSMRWMLGQRVDRIQRFQCLRELPVVLELGGVQLSPLADQPHRPGRKLTVDDLQGSEPDLGNVLAVLRVEVRRRVIGPIHVDHDPVEGRHPRHPAIVAGAPASLAPAAANGVRATRALARRHSGYDATDPLPALMVWIQERIASRYPAGSSPASISARSMNATWSCSSLAEGRAARTVSHP